MIPASIRADDGTAMVIQRRSVAAAACDDLEPSWRRAVHDYPLPMIIVDLVAHEAVDANDAALDLFALRDGRPVNLRDHVQLDVRHRRLAELVRSGTVDSFEAQIATKQAEGPPVQLRVWVHALDRSRAPRRYAVAAVTEDGAVDPTRSPPMARTRDMVAGAIDGDWTCEWVTREVTALLGYRRDEFVGMPLLALAHPEIAGELVMALSHAGDTASGTILHARLRGADGGWRTVQMIVTPRPDDRPGAMFLLLEEQATPVRTGGRARPSDRLDETAGDRHTAALARDGGWATGALPELSTRQWEIVTRLQRGERVPGIAQAMYLSPSTIRNHLTAVFRKFGVHSQAELLACLRAGSTSVQSV